MKAKYDKKQKSLNANSQHLVDHQRLVQWYLQNKRDLPWRKSKDPYRIWLSEVMLQQTTVTAVIPYFENFLARFPEVASLASAPENEVLEAWAGLGYYSRARNLHKAAKEIHSAGFPKFADDLIKLPGFGPYTSRAVASIAFGEKVGVLDGNVIRVLCRKYGLKVKWWNNQGRQQLQDISDELAGYGQSDDLNQGLMELGATICTPQKTLCVLCPWSSDCEARKNDLVETLPLKKPRKESEVWVWEPIVDIKNKKVALIENNYAPFLKGQLIFPGKIKQQKNKPKDYDVKHSITHHGIYIIIDHIKTDRKSKVQWIELTELKKVNPSSLLQKVLQKVLS